MSLPKLSFYVEDRTREAVMLPCGLMMNGTHRTYVWVLWLLLHHGAQRVPLQLGTPEPLVNLFASERHVTQRAELDLKCRGHRESR